MFDYLPEVGRELHSELVTVYWLLLVPYVVFIIILELLKSSDEGPKVGNIIKRVVLSILMLISIDLTLNTIAMIGDGVTTRIDGMAKLWEVLKNLGPNYENASNEWFNLRETAIYVFNVGAYIIAYLGFFVATALMHFVWTVLYICSPLMILMYVSERTAYVTRSLYKGLINVVVWKILWSILGVLLLKLAMSPKFTGLEDYLMSIIVNLCIGISMLFIPIATKSLLSDGFSSAASAISVAPAMAAATTMKSFAKKWSKKSVQGGASGLGHVSRPITNPITGRAQMISAKLKPRLDKFRKEYSELNLPKQLKNSNRRRNNSEEK